MNSGLMTAFLIIGAGVGLALPEISKSITAFKCKEKNTELIYDSRYTSLLLKVGLCIFNGVAWGLAGLFSESILSAVLVSMLFTIAVIIAIIDIRIRIIPNELLLIMLAMGIAYQAVSFGLMAILTSLVCMVVMIIVFTAVAGFVGMDKVGAGDVKLAGAMGLVLGYPNVITAVLIMSAVFLIFTLIGMTLRKLTLKSMLPFAPFMMTGMIFTLAFMMY